jgi:hypothetical protein
MKLRYLITIFAIFVIFEPVALAGSGFTVTGFNSSNNSFDYAYNINSVLGGARQLSLALLAGRSGDAISNAQEHLLSQERNSVRSDTQLKKVVYLVCAARYSAGADAERHVETLRRFGFSSKIELKDQNIFRVVLGKTDQRLKAEKAKTNYEKRGVSCFIEEE